jgi:acyl-CoA thioesterase FadM
MGMQLEGEKKITVLVVQANLQFKWSLAYPNTAFVGVKVMKVGNTSLHLRTDMYQKGDENRGPACQVDMYYVFADMQTMRPIPIPSIWRSKL